MSPNVSLGTKLKVPYARKVGTTYQRRSLSDVYEFIVTYKREHDGNSPTIRTIGEACGISSTSVVHNLLVRLAMRGWIRRPEPRIGTRYAENIEVIGGKWIAPIAQNVED